jgi:hypothetical protein
MRVWWRSLSRTDRVAILGLVVAILGVIPAYLAFFTGGPGGQPAPPEPKTTVSTTRPRESTTRPSDASDTSLSSMSTSTLEPEKLDPPLKVQVISQPQFVPEGLAHSGIYLFAGPEPSPADVPADLRGLERMAAYEKWAQSKGGVPAQTLALRMTVRAAGSAPVVLNGLRIDVVRRSAPLSGWFRFPDAGCGVQPVRTIDIDLDKNPVRPMLLEVDATGQEKPPRPFRTLRVTRTDIEVFEVHARTVRSDVEFKMTLLYQSENDAGEFPVEGGQTYRVTALRAGRARAYDTPATSSGSGTPVALERTTEMDPGPQGLTLC